MSFQVCVSTGGGPTDVVYEHVPDRFEAHQLVQQVRAEAPRGAVAWYEEEDFTLEDELAEEDLAMHM